MRKSSTDRISRDPIALRLAALAGLVDDLIRALVRRQDRIEVIRTAVATARDETSTSEPVSRVQPRSVDERK